MKPLRAVCHNENGINPATNIKLPTGFADRNVLKVIIDLSTCASFKIRQSTESMDTGDTVPFTFTKTDGTSTAKAFADQIVKNGEEIASYLGSIRKRFTKLETLVLMDDTSAEPVFRATLKEVLESMFIFLKQYFKLNRLRPPELIHDPVR